MVWQTISVGRFQVLSRAAPLALEGGHVSGTHIGVLYLKEAIGGAFFGLAIGWIAHLVLKSVDNYQVEVLLTVALVTGG
ncbi:MAG TPA: hypothetical protein VG938_15205 [Verrucomicrobiae bacterium]|jgi:CPA1 family monovalent cation:H+ antiporter|nr:hypothetical protein [Verrucomicrobiae bacterium]